ncbi:oxaloacetate decarboxylase [Actinomadura sp. LOL_016]|uniref:isocitrate lyase/PEP mutase family protein n=1 Tax=unclassified Actinomadura TaxID=2626254 RepID=UPI003A7FD1CB
MPFSPAAPRPTTRLRELLAADGPVVMPGCYDALSARMIERAGFPAAAISGFAIETALLGGPDIGLMTLTELTDQARRITGAVDIPVITDVDTGFGGVNNIFRTVRSLEQAGIAGFHLEDQVTPKRCPVLPGRTLVPVEEAVGRYTAALEARTDPDFMIIARTDGDAVSYDEQITRANRYLEAGVDAVLPMIMEHDGAGVGTLPSDRQMEIILRTVKDVDGPVMYVGDPPPGYRTADLAQAGVKILSQSAVTLNAAANAMHEVLAELAETGESSGFDARRPRHVEAGRSLMDVMRVDHYLDFELRHTPERKAL